MLLNVKNTCHCLNDCLLNRFAFASIASFFVCLFVVLRLNEYGVFAALAEIYCKIGKCKLETIAKNNFSSSLPAQCKLDQIEAVEIHLNVAKMNRKMRIC